MDDGGKILHCQQFRILVSTAIACMFTSACADPPRLKSNQNTGDLVVAPMVEFVDKPAKKSSLTSVSIGVKASNKMTVKYAYAFIAAIGDCRDGNWSVWRNFDEKITLSDLTIGHKTLCAKGKRANDTEQQQPIRYQWQVVAADNGNSGSGDDGSGSGDDGSGSGDDGSGSGNGGSGSGGSGNGGSGNGGSGNGGSGSGGSGSGGSGGSGDDSNDKENFNFPQLNFSNNDTGNVGGAGIASISSKKDEEPVAEPAMMVESYPAVANEEVATDNLRLNKNSLVFASAARNEQSVEIENISASGLKWSVRSTQTELLLQVTSDDDKDSAVWHDVVAKNDKSAIVQGDLSMEAEEILRFRLADPYKTDYDSDKEIEVTISDGSKSVVLTVHIFVPQLEIKIDDKDKIEINKNNERPQWDVNLEPLKAEKKLKIEDRRDSNGGILSWKVWPYRWLPNWLNIEKSEDGKELQFKLSDDCSLYPQADEDDVITLIIASNSGSKDVTARSFALHTDNQEISWQEEILKSDKYEIEDKFDPAYWRTNDIRYVVVRFKPDSTFTCD